MSDVSPIRDLKGYLDPVEIHKVIACTTNPRDGLLVRIPWRTGIRVGEGDLHCYRKNAYLSSSYRVLTIR